MLNTSQCSTSSIFRCGAASGSCMYKTKLTVFGGTFDHISRGETGLGSDCVNLAGISAPSANAAVVRVRPGPAGAFLGASWATAAPRAAVNRVAQIVNARVVLMVGLPRLFRILATRPHPAP